MGLACFKTCIYKYKLQLPVNGSGKTRLLFEGVFNVYMNIQNLEKLADQVTIIMTGHLVQGSRV